MPSAENIIQIKKYSNRRLYSPKDACFLTLSELAQLVRSGKKVCVTDSNTDHDITSEILTQILLENGRAQLFPVEVLEQMLRMNEQALRGFWEKYFDQSLKVIDSFQSNLKSLQKASSFFQDFVNKSQDAKASKSSKRSSKSQTKK